MLYRYIHIIYNIHTMKAKFDKVILTGKLDVMCSIWRKNICFIQQHSNIMQDEGRRCFTKTTHEGQRFEIS